MSGPADASWSPSGLRQNDSTMILSGWAMRFGPRVLGSGRREDSERCKEGRQSQIEGPRASSVEKRVESGKFVTCSSDSGPPERASGRACQMLPAHQLCLPMVGIDWWRVACTTSLLILLGEFPLPKHGVMDAVMRTVTKCLLQCCQCSLLACLMQCDNPKVSEVHNCVGMGMARSTRGQSILLLVALGENPSGGPGSKIT